ncbi:ferredoxin--NADP reductase [Olivibacter sp. SDN3]|uniref:ferredoxin--NADP reductase n=1 Tax=Olivibacter sp. SDN3 TaxID=2764720 RepID=UPI0016512B2D|nr:ferredoxin--NADP reductase [Olivibacter sp. SDN3]QNL49625.1 ferredoxin--NADP reductase [Olivibacter sp. SDN3]
MHVNSRSDLFRLRIEAIVDEAVATRSFVLKNLEKQPLEYQSGQFLTLLFNDAIHKEVRRSYSISSSPAYDPLTITLKKIPNGEFSRKLVDHAQVGDVLTSIGASGLFTIPTVSIPSHFCCFAAGSGITPIFSIIKTLLYGHHNTSVTLIYSNKNPSTTIFMDDLLQLKEIFKERFNLEFLFSESSSILESRLTQDVIDRLVEKYALYELPGTLFYLCGPNAYMRMLSIKLRADGIADNNIKREIFVIEKPLYKLPEPPDKSAHDVIVHIDGNRFTINVQYPTSILEAAKKAHIPIPYSCENGQCGTCAAICSKGEVWMRHNEVLGEKSIRDGYVLTCTGYPTDGLVELLF